MLPRSFRSFHKKAFINFFFIKNLSFENFPFMSDYLREKNVRIISETSTIKGRLGSKEYQQELTSQ